MNYYYTFLFFVFLFSLYSIFSDIFNVRTFISASNMRNITKKNKVKRNFISDLEQFFLNKIIKFYKIEDEFEKNKWDLRLKIAGINESAEYFFSRIYAKLIVVFIFVLIFLPLVPFISIFLIVASIFLYFDEVSKPERIIAKKKESIERELPRFTNQINEELKSTNNVVVILEKYLKSAGDAFKHELNITLSDIRTGNTIVALTRLESRVRSNMLSEITRGLIGVARGDDNRVYFSSLAINFRKEEIEKLKREALQIPGRIKKYSFIIAAEFILLFLIVLANDILVGLGKLF